MPLLPAVSLSNLKLGILHTPVSAIGARSLNVSMRKDLDIYASVALIQNIPGVQSRHQNVNFVMIRENTEGEYSGLEHQVSLLILPVTW